MNDCRPNDLSIFSDVPYRPQDPKDKDIPIGLVGCGGISFEHLTAYRNAGYNVVAFFDIDIPAAQARRDEFYPDAQVFDQLGDLLAMESIQVVDITTHTEVRPPLIEQAILAGKHVLSQKPFVLDLAEGQRLVQLANTHQVLLGVNQNARWAPHFSYARHAAQKGLLGHVLSANLTVHWDHTWVEGTQFEKIKHLILYDYAIHWFDFVANLFEHDKAKTIHASANRTSDQTLAPPLIGQASIEFESAVATLFFNGGTRFGPQHRMYIAGSNASVLSDGPSDREQQLEVVNQQGRFSPALQGTWFPDGFHGTMGEMLCAIEENRRPSIDAERNLKSLELCFAAIRSAETGQPIVPGSVRSIEEASDS